MTIPQSMPHLTANDLKTRGVAAIEATLAHRPEAVISVRGKEKYVVMEVAQYHYLRECELDAALAQSRADVAEGRFVAETAQEHMVRIEALLPIDENRERPVLPRASRKAPSRRTR